MDKHTMEILKAWKERQKVDLFKLGHSVKIDKQQLVFTNTSNEFLHFNKTTRWINYLQDKYELEKITTHGLRHTHCSLLFEAGVNIERLKERLGHSDIQTTMNIYTHVTQKAKEETAEKFIEYMSY